ncbi:MAG TPA: hypothetical protein VMS86_02665 [Thermoanaerobaculia bacterium]|nr:hypothetical protein [Thermoanaerobaculia bacterium]
MHQPQPTESADPAAQSPDIRQLETGGVAHDYLSHRTVAAEQNTDLTADLARDRGQMASQLERHHLVDRDPPAERPLESFALGSFETEKITVEVGDGYAS